MASKPASGSPPTATTNSLFSFLCSTADFVLLSLSEEDVLEHPANVPITKTNDNSLAIFFFNFISYPPI